MLFLYIKLAGPIPFSVNSVTTNKSDTFQVIGEGKVVVRPDIAKIQVGVESQGSTVKLAQDQLNSAINKVSQSIKALGVDEKDIQTENYNIYPNRDYTSSSQKITGYSASSNLSIKIKDINKINFVLDAATASGANQVGGITFDVEDKTKAENQAREKAVKEAKKKAEEAAKVAGFRLGKIVNYSESFQGEGPPFLDFKSAQVSQAGGSPSQVEPGSNEVRVIVTLSYEVR